jgi:Resolvase, N terminal domain
MQSVEIRALLAKKLSELTATELEALEANLRRCPTTNRALRIDISCGVSTSEQTTDNQRRELLAVATRHGWKVVAEFEHAGVSGSKGRDQRPGLDALLKAVARREFDMVAAWSVDPLRTVPHRLAEAADRAACQGRRSVPAPAGA